MTTQQVIQAVENKIKKFENLLVRAKQRNLPFIASVRGEDSDAHKIMTEIYETLRINKDVLTYLK